MSLSRKDIEAFHADGAIALRGVVDAGWLRVLADAIEDDIAAPGSFHHAYEPEDGRGRFHGNLRTWEFHEGFQRFCFESPLPRLAGEILGCRRINLLYDQLFVKEPGILNPSPGRRAHRSVKCSGFRGGWPWLYSLGDLPRGCVRGCFRLPRDVRCG